VTLGSALVGAAIAIGAVHTCAPDHWMPFAALGRAERWSGRRTAAITAACGLGHVTVSVLLGLIALVFGREVLETLGQRMESVSGLLLIGFGVAYAAWGLRNALADRLHQHAHAHGHPHVHVHLFPGASHVPDTRLPSAGDAAGGGVTPWTLFLLFSADPCVAVIPLMFAAAPLGWSSTVAVIVAYEAATIATMVLLVLPARAAAATIRGAWADRYGDALAGGVVALVGLAVLSLGI
jgi:ABC-type nickel/cobalt efflux system permease component RcnA